MTHVDQTAAQTLASNPSPFAATTAARESWWVPTLRWILRFVVGTWLRLAYCLRARTLRQLPAEGAALLVANHVTFIDALLLTTQARRPVRFVMDRAYWRKPVIGPVCRLFGAIPITSAQRDPGCLAQAFDAIDAALARGELVAIFPEGRLTADGEVGGFRPGVAQILARRPVPVVPMAFMGLWGSVFSRAPGSGRLRLLGHALARLVPVLGRRKVEVVVGEAVAPEAARIEVLRDAVLALRTAP